MLYQYVLCAKIGQTEQSENEQAFHDLINRVIH